MVAIIAVGSDLGSNRKVLEIAREHDNFVFPALGLHPANLPGARIDRELEFLEGNIDMAKAVGEVGLDYHKRVVSGAAKELQKTVLKEVLAIARRHGKPAIIHSRYAWKDALALVEEAGLEKAVFHWFTGPSGVLRDIIQSGYHVSATPAAEYHAEHKRAVKAVPLENLLIETDSPVRYGIEVRWQSEPADVIRALRAAAEVRAMDGTELARITTDNARRLFDLPGE